MLFFVGWFFLPATRSRTLTSAEARTGPRSLVSLGRCGPCPAMVSPNQPTPFLLCRLRHRLTINLRFNSPFRESLSRDVCLSR